MTGTSQESLLATLVTALQAAQKRLESVDDNSTEAIAVRIVVGAALEQAAQ